MRKWNKKACSISMMIMSPYWLNTSVASDINEPFRSANRHPLVQIYGLPEAESALISGLGKWNAGLTIEASNNFTVEQSGSESLAIDGETYRSELNWRYGLFEGVELGLAIPFISHQGGGGDEYIEDWHDIFGFPDGDRIRYPQDQLRYAYQRDGQVLLDMDKKAEGLGDISINVAYQLSAGDLRQWAIKAGVKLSTGDADYLHGSEADDTYVSLHMSDQHLLSDYNLVFHASGGALMLGDGKVLAEQQEDLVWFGSGTLSWVYSEKISLKTQFDMHTAFYDSGLKQLGDTSLQWLVGASFQIAKQGFIDVSVSEDLAVEAAPDIVFQLAIRVGEW